VFCSIGTASAAFTTAVSLRRLRVGNDILLFIVVRDDFYDSAPVLLVFQVFLAQNYSSVRFDPSGLVVVALFDDVQHDERWCCGVA
jgi:hypothetical protein